MKANRLLLAVGFVAVIVFVIAESFTSNRIAHAQSRWSPYTLQQENRMFDATHNGDVISEKTFARRSDGAYSELSSVGSIKGYLAGEKIRKVVLATGEQFVASDQFRAVSRLTSPEFAAQQRNNSSLNSNKNPSCVGTKEQTIGKQTIMGQQAVGAIWPATIPNRKVTEWRAINLGCQVLSATIEDKQTDGSWKVHNQIATTSLVLGEPDTSLFDLPPDYTEMKPSEMEHKTAERLGGPWTPEIEKSAAARDALYAKYH